jgi:tetratricopeptide (TPR) repeat protein
MFQLGAARESKTWLEETLRMSATCPDKLRTRALAEASIQAAITGDAEAAVRHAADAAELVVGLDEPKLRGEVLLAASLAQWVLGRLAEAERLTTEALAYADETGNEALAGDLRNNLCYLALQTGKLQLAREMGETALADARRRCGPAPDRRSPPQSLARGDQERRTPGGDSIPSGGAQDLAAAWSRRHASS